ncbi:YibE/F family protein [Vallitalea pronyensis]|uniref:YibE/F family protein n=1 Tax=Vallitalea pronyensis TaxID=1348613 RepID=A0A8J8MGT1_9FIRM|nr:YibE/F family protein [Vallitalea pronyensis]QUI21512.1 YibE/F family protein [Vallitalea pronyensis]
MRYKIMFFFVALLSLGFLTQDVYGASPNDQYEETDEIIPGKVLAILRDEQEVLETSGGDYIQKIQVLKVKLLKGPDKGQLIEVYNTTDGIMGTSLDAKVGDELYCRIERDEKGNIVRGYIDKVKRDRYLILLVVIFILLTLGIGRLQGLKTLITLGITIVGVYYMLRGIINGQDPILISILVSLVVTIITMFIIGGFNRKAISAIIGTLSGVLIAGIIALIVGYYGSLSGLGTTEAQMLLFATDTLQLDFKGILFASILLGTLGAVMDVCMSISSSITELKSNNPLMSVGQLFKSGMNIGKDVMGTMSNTLILAYAGTSLCLMLLFMVNDMSFAHIINMDQISTEIVRAMAGTIGLIISIPITAIVSALLAKTDYDAM